MRTPFEIAQSALEDCCDFNPRFVGNGSLDPITGEYLVESLRIAESMVCDDGRAFDQLFPLVRAELIAFVLVCETEQAEDMLQRYSDMWASRQHDATPES